MIVVNNLQQLNLYLCIYGILNKPILMRLLYSIDYILYSLSLKILMMATDIISPASFMDPQESQPERKQHQHISYFIKNPTMVQVLQKKGIKFFFPIQYSTFKIIHSGQDLIGRDRTGSGKTIAYSLPIIQRFRQQDLMRNPYIKFLIVLPTRELCIQVANEIDSLKLSLKEFTVLALYGGVELHQHINKLRDKVDIIVATPGRLIDLLQRGKVNFEGIECLCLDQADEMLKMGFQQDVEKIYHHVNKVAYKKPQSLLFSATVPLWVERIAAKFMHKQRQLIDLIKDAEIKTSKTVTHCSMCIKYKDIIPLMKDIVNVYCGKHGRCIIFCQRKSEVNDILLQSQLNIQAEALHSDIPQSHREITFKKFKEGRLKCLISTNVAARGLDIPSVDLVIQLEPPKKVDDYIHRSGRTGRAGKKGVCLTIYLKSQQYLLRNIQKVANIRFKDIGPPQPDDILNRMTIDLIHHLKAIDENVLDYFEWLAGEMIYEVGAEKALARALAFITGIKQRIPCQSVMNKIQGMLTYKFKATQTNRGEIKPHDLIKFLQQKITLDGKAINISEIITKTVQTVTPRCLAFEFPEIFLKKMQALQHQQHPEFEIIRVSAISQLTNEQVQEDELPQYSQEEYDQAMYNNFELYIGRLQPEADAYELQKLFHKKGIKFVNLDVKNKDGKKGFGFMKCLTEKDLMKAVELNGELTFCGVKLELRVATEKKKDKGGDRDHKKKHHHHEKREYEN